ncbi:CCA tRNA nucleotidyltransferase, mitochondrial, partial [Ascosphaera acerosa]
SHEPQRLLRASEARLSSTVAKAERQSAANIEGNAIELRRKLPTSIMISTRAQIMPSIELTPLEETLKCLLLDVAAYISNPQSEYQSEPHGTPEGLVLRFTGGWVRDKLLGVPSKDIDVGISSMTGYQFGLALKDYLDDPANLERYKNRNAIEEDKIISLHKISANPEKSKHLETVTTKIFGLEVDLVNLRKETYTEDSRNPQMQFGTPYEDAMRRDATVNALFYNLNTSSIEDFTGRGLQDMDRKLIRTPLEPFQTFKDDPLRVLRLIRFSSRLGYEIDPDTAAAMGHPEIREALKIKISPERVGIEVQKCLQGPDPVKALEFIDRQGLYNMIFINHKDQVQAETRVSAFTWSSAYHALQSIKQGDVGEDVLLSELVRSPQSQRQAWMLAAFAPWSVVPLNDSNGNVVAPSPKNPPRAQVVARDAMRLDNHTAGVIGDATAHAVAIQDLKEEVLTGATERHVTPGAFRERLGRFLRGLGSEWRSSILLALLLECARTPDRRTGKADPLVAIARYVTADILHTVFHSYHEFLGRLDGLNLFDVHLMKPILNGHDIAAGLGVPPGAWMAKALDTLICWQLRNPSVTGSDADKAAAIQEIRGRREQLRWDVPPAKKGSKTAGKGKKAK